jgi:hypothetical protein
MGNIIGQNKEQNIKLDKNIEGQHKNPKGEDGKGRR